MPSVNSKERAIYLAVSVAACAGCLMGVGSLLLYQRLRRDARGMTRLAYSFDYHFLTPPSNGLLPFMLWPFPKPPPFYPIVHPRRDLVALRREYEEIRRLVETLRDFQPPTPPLVKPIASVAVAEDIADSLYQHHVAERRSSGSTADDDLAEFYDARSDDLSPDYESPVISNSISNGHLHSPSDDLEEVYRRADVLLAYEKDFTVEDRREAYDLIKSYYAQNQSNFEYLWQLARVTYLYGRALLDVDEPKRKELCFEAKKYAFDSLAINDHDAEVHKWCALTIGTLTDFVGVGQKLKDGMTFKFHIDKALQLRKDDSTLHHLAGRWYYGVAELSWLERNAAKVIFGGQVPEATYQEALGEFLDADRIKPCWKENLLYIALCYHYIGDKGQARNYLEKARETPSVSMDDSSAEKEIEKLWQKYGN